MSTADYLTTTVGSVLRPLLLQATREQPEDFAAWLIDQLQLKASVSDQAIHLFASISVHPGMEARAKLFCEDVLYGAKGDKSYVDSMTPKDGQNVMCHRSSIEKHPDGRYTLHFEEVYDTHKQVLLHMVQFGPALGDNLGELASVGDLAAMKLEVTGPEKEMELLSKEASLQVYPPEAFRWHLRTSYRPSRPAVSAPHDKAIHFRMIFDIKPGKEEEFWRAVHEFRQIHQRIMGEAAGTTHFGICSDGGSKALLREGYSCEGMVAYFKILEANSEYAAIHTRVLKELATLNMEESSIVGRIESLEPLMKMIPESHFGILAGGLRRVIE